ncbi:MAG: hypothetical protein DWQ05_12115 [Calditrichaeota bacterium]|nr:MAG: hypothetical protein DWQ05_12115 [Calditrichota bacterium]
MYKIESFQDYLKNSVIDIIFVIPDCFYRDSMLSKSWSPAIKLPSEGRRNKTFFDLCSKIFSK